jgi:alpha-glucosidase
VDCFVFERRAPGERFLMALNCSDQPQDLSLPGLGDAQALLSTQMDREGSIDLSTLTLRPHEGIIVALTE